MSLILTALPGMESYAAGETGESAAQTDLQDENGQRLETVTAMDENGNIYEVGDSDGTVGESAAEDGSEEGTDAESGISLFSARSAAVSMKVVNFNTKSNATTDFTYSGGSGYTNGDYGADAAYLGTDGSGDIRFMLAGVTGTVKKSEVEVVDYSSVADNVSYYEVSGGQLIHYISYNLNEGPSSSINNGPAPSYLSEGVKYFSYDGHYFYEDYKTMLNDYQSGSNGASAVNCGNAFYNYFQFLDMNSSTNYSGDELDSILSSKISSSSSKLLGTGTLFVKYQNKYSVNALLSLGIAVNESAWGTSSICMDKNNLFGLNAVDTSPGQSANYFASVEDCIREFMSEWMADGYLSSSDWRNHGELLGNKGEGINVSYASDPYWGEKAAAIAWELDAAGGSHDYLGISSGSGNESSEDNTDTPSEDNMPPSDAGGTDDANDSSAADNDSDTDDPSEEDSDSEADSSVDTGNGSETENPTDANEPSDTNDPTDANEPSDTNDPTDTNEPSDTNDPTDTNEPSDTNNPTDTNEPSDTGTPSEEENDSETDGGVDEENGSEAEEPTDANDPADTNEPIDTNKPVDTDTPSDESSNSGADKKPADTPADRQLADIDHGVSVSGRFSEDAALNVQAVEPNTDQYATYVIADPVKGKVVLGVYDITLTGTLEGEAQLTFRVGTEYNGRNVIILHYADDGSYETYKAAVENGQVTISVKGFSPYVIALDDANSSSSIENKAPQTGDTAEPGIWIALMGMAIVLGAAAIFKKRAVR